MILVAVLLCVCVCVCVCVCAAFVVLYLPFVFELNSFVLKRWPLFLPHAQDENRKWEVV